MDLARKRKIDTLLVWRFDRFARSLAHLVNSLEELRRLGVDFISFQESIDTSSPQGRLLFGIMASLAEFERSLIRERIMAGLRRSQSQGKVPGPKRNFIDITKLREMTAKGLSLRNLARLFGVSKDTIRNLQKAENKGVENPPSISSRVSVEALEACTSV